MTIKTIQYTERMVGAGHPVYSDTLNRLTLVAHNTDGSHKGYVEASQYNTTPSSNDGLQNALLVVPLTTQIVVSDIQSVAGGTTISHPVCVKPSGSVYVPSGTVTLNGPVTASSNAFTGSGNITINGAFFAPLTQVFSGSGSVVFSAGSVSEVYPEWWGIDGIADDVQIQAALTAVSNGEIVRLVSHKTYTMAAGLTIQVPKHRLVGSLSKLDFSALSAPVCITIDGVSAVNPYSHTCTIIDGVEIIGDAYALTGGTGIVLEGTDANQNPSKCVIANTIIRELANGVVTKGNAYIVALRDCEIYHCHTCYYVPSGYTNYGERMVLDNCTLYNSHCLINNSNGNSDIICLSTSFDYSGNSNSPQFSVSAGRVFFYGCHFEWAYNVGTGIPFTISGESRVFIFGGDMMSSSSSTGSYDYIFSVGSNSSCTVYGMRWINMIPAVAIGTGAGRLIINDIEYNSTSNVLAIGKDNCLKDGSFESGSIQQDYIFLNSDTATITSRVTGTNIALTASTVTASTGTYSLRAAKAGGAGSNASFIIAVPAGKGDRFSVRFKCNNNNSRSATNIACAAYWGVINGCDGNGVPVFSVAASYASINFTPTNTWTQYAIASVVNGADAAACPSWATHHIVAFNMFNFAGGVGASEGGNYSLYFDEFEIYQF